jgi:peptidoglycan/xylan/chitin deacetylase (PgdA/CDA1 family)
VKIPILLYHGIGSDGSGSPWVMDPGRFREHMDVVAATGRPTSTVSDHVASLATSRGPAPGTVLVTFDDGLACFGREAWPIMRERDITCTLYVVSGQVGQDAAWLGADAPPMLTWDDIRRLDAEGCEIGAHSVSHPQLDVVPRDVLPHEVRSSRTAIALQLDHPVRSFAYPHGFHDRKVVEEVRRAGYSSACAVRNLFSSARDDPFALARITVDSSWTAEDLARVLDGEGPATAPRRTMLRTRAWRRYRRLRRAVGAP